MKTVALISGGKDSCFNMLQCVAEGHQIVALANLKPEDKDELDSYMYQTVGHQAIELYAEAMELPLYRHTIRGTALDTGRDYIPLETDEVEDLYHLLNMIKNDMEIEAVAVGAILSDYQRVRVENVCLRLGLTPLAYLWRREQAELLQEMVNCQMDVILIKVAALGLEPDSHLGCSLKQILPHMMKMQKQFGLNVCGEGGEYETFTLDCPLFHKKLIVDEKETVIHSADAFAPVGYIHFKQVHLEDKRDERSWQDRIQALPLTTSVTVMESLRSQISHDSVDKEIVPDLDLPPVSPLIGSISVCSKATQQYFSVGSVMAFKQDDLEATSHKAMEQLKGAVESLSRTMADVYSVCLYVSKMSDFASINSVYKTYFGINPPVRICVGAYLPENVLFQMDCQGCWNKKQGEDSSQRRTMHVQGISHWAPANIGPYSQATVVDGRVFIAGQIPLVPGTMKLVSGSVAVQCRLSLQHTSRVLEAMCPGRCLQDILLCVCYVTHPDVICIAKQQWDELYAEKKDDLATEATHRPHIEYVVVPSLPRAACVEWQVYGRCEDTDIEELSVTNVNTSVRAKCLYSRTMTSLFTASVHVDVQSGRELDAAAALAACLDGYTQLLVKIDKSWNEVPLLRIFYPSRLYSYDILHEAWTHHLNRVSDSAVTVSLVPVVQLENKNTAMLLCH